MILHHFATSFNEYEEKVSDLAHLLLGFFASLSFSRFSIWLLMLELKADHCKGKKPQLFDYLTQL